jgi:linoleoyl-CoA desaturase
VPETATIASLAPSQLWFIDGQAYDLRKFVEKHPGGREALWLAQGTNCTELFRTYHLLSGPSKALLLRYRIEVDRKDPHMVALLGGSSFTFEEDGFYKTVARRARDYFRETKQHSGSTKGLQWFAIGSVLLIIALAVPAFAFGNLWAAVALGLMRGITSVGPGHSMSHFSQFPRGNWNSLLFRLASPFLVSSWSIWTNSHVRSHHVVTLTPADLQDHYPLKRIQPSLPHRAWHRFQHFYIWPLYLFALPLWSLQDFLESVVSLFVTPPPERRFSFARRVENVLAIGFNLLLFVGMPFLLDVGTAFVVLFITTAIASPWVVIQIVVNHEVPETMRTTDSPPNLDWGAHQVITSHNFGVNSRLALHLSGGLNMQVEHHLFPGVHYRHYPALSKIVQAACSEFGLPYHTSAHVFEAMAKHYRALKLNSTPDGFALQDALGLVKNPGEPRAVAG